EKKEKKLSQLKVAMKVVTDQELPFNDREILELILGEDEDKTASNIEKLSSLYKQGVEKAVKKALGEANGRDEEDLPETTKKRINTLEKQYQEAVASKNTKEAIRIQNQIWRKKANK